MCTPKFSICATHAVTVTPLFELVCSMLALGSALVGALDDAAQGWCNEKNVFKSTQVLRATVFGAAGFCAGQCV